MQTAKDHTTMAVFIIKPYIAILSRNNAVYGRFTSCIMLAILGLMAKSYENPGVLLGRRIRALRTAKGWTQQELGERADINYKFLGEIERGQQNPSFNSLAKIAVGLELDLSELFRFEHEIADRKKLEARIRQITKAMPDDELRQLLMVLRALFPTR